MSSKLLKNLGKRIKEQREYNNWTISELSKRTGIRKQYLKSIEKGMATRINLEHYERICKAFDVSYKFLLK